MMYTNEANHGGEVESPIERGLTDSHNVTIASGYVSHDVISRFENHFYRIAESGGRFRLLVGMAFYEGMSPRTYHHLIEVDKKLRTKENGSGIYVVYSRRYHGKIYRFEGKDEKIYLGSSNFSASGLKDNLEATAEITDSEEKNRITSYLDFLFSEENATSLQNADIALYGTKSYQERIAIQSLDDCDRYDPKDINFGNAPQMTISLERLADKPKSNLNAYFGEGRLNRKTGKITPRPWYEVEVIVPKEIVEKNEIYPRGEFTAYTDDGYIIPMQTGAESSDYKNFRSKGNLLILGQWIKNKLQRSGALTPLTPVTRETLEIYGNANIDLYKLEEKKYYMKF